MPAILSRLRCVRSSKRGHYFQGYLRMSFRRNLHPGPDLTYTVQVSDDLETWRDGSAPRSGSLF